jgi:tryptophan synthase alpha subunit
VADGAIIGSAIVRRMQLHRAEGVRGMVSAVESYCRSLREG